MPCLKEKVEKELPEFDRKSESRIVHFVLQMIQSLCKVIYPKDPQALTLKCPIVPKWSKENRHYSKTKKAKKILKIVSYSTFTIFALLAFFLWFRCKRAFLSQCHLHIRVLVWATCAVTSVVKF